MRLTALALLAAALVPTQVLAGGAVGYREANDFFGRTLALGGDRLAVGVDGANVEGFNAGLVHVYVYQDGEWQLEARLRNPAEAPANGDFGRFVALAGDTLVVGARLEDRGVLYLYQYDGEQWRLQASLDDPDTDHDRFGQTFALAGDTLAIGAYDRSRDRLPLPSQVWILRRAGDEWGEEARFDLPEDSWSRALALGDGTLLVSSLTPSVTAYRRTGTAWSVAPAPNVESPYLVDLTIDGDTALIVGAVGPERVLVYRDVDAAWSLEAEIDYSRGAKSAYLNALALAGDWAAFGFSDYDGTSHSRVALWHRQDGGWQHVDDVQLPAESTENAPSFGDAVAVDARWLAVGDPLAGEARRSQSGLVHVYANEAGLPEVARLGPDDEPPGCGCRTGGGPMGLLIGLFALGRRRRSR